MEWLFTSVELFLKDFCWPPIKNEFPALKTPKFAPSKLGFAEVAPISKKLNGALPEVVENRKLSKMPAAPKSGIVETMEDKTNSMWYFFIGGMCVKVVVGGLMFLKLNCSLMIKVDMPRRSLWNSSKTSDEALNKSEWDQCDLSGGMQD